MTNDRMEPGHTGRDDPFTPLHKALRRGLFEVTMQAGATDWNDPAEVVSLADRWRPLLALLRAHTEHEDRHILRALDPYGHGATASITERHAALDDLLDQLAEDFDRLVIFPYPAGGPAFYRDLNHFVAAYLPHLHEEETQIMPRIWARCTDEEIAAARAAFVAGTPPEVMHTALELMLPSLNRPERDALVGRMAATAPPETVARVLAIADRVLPDAAAASLRDLAMASAGVLMPKK